VSATGHLTQSASNRRSSVPPLPQATTIQAGGCGKRQNIIVIQVIIDPSCCHCSSCSQPVAIRFSLSHAECVAISAACDFRCTAGFASRLFCGAEEFRSAPEISLPSSLAAAGGGAAISSIRLWHLLYTTEYDVIATNRHTTAPRSCRPTRLSSHGPECIPQATTWDHSGSLAVMCSGDPL